MQALRVAILSQRGVHDLLPLTLQYITDSTGHPTVNHRMYTFTVPARMVVQADTPPRAMISTGTEGFANVINQPRTYMFTMSKSLNLFDMRL